ncbi:MAG: outer membrane protein OmpA [Nevskia sp.]|nr:outer membrane protein OmpA [Nevskia sp.]
MNAKCYGLRLGWMLAALAGLPLPLLAQVDVGPTLAGSLGATLQNNRSVTASSPGAPGSSDGSARLGTGISAGITPGYTFNDNFRSDLELSYRDKPGKGDSIDEKAYSALGNLWVDVIHQSGYFIYFGGGLGVADVRLHSSDGSDSAIAPAWQLGGGAGVTLMSNWAISADFRRVTAFEKSKFHVDSTEDLKTRYGTNAVTISLRYAFGGMPAPLFGGSTD